MIGRRLILAIVIAAAMLDAPGLVRGAGMTDWLH